MDKERNNSFLIFAIVLAGFMAWQYLRAPGSHPASVGVSTTAPVPAAAAVSVKRETHQIAVSSGSVVVANSGPIIAGWELSTYHKQGVPGHEGKVEIPAPERETLEDLVGGPAVELGFDSNDYLYLKSAAGKQEIEGNGVVWRYEDAKVKITRRIEASKDQPYANVAVLAEFKAAPPKFAFLSVEGRAAGNRALDADRKVFYQSGSHAESLNVTKKLDEAGMSPGGVHWIASVDRYFALAVVPQKPNDVKAVMQTIGDQQQQVSLVYPLKDKTLDLSARVFFGPKKLEILKGIEPSLDQSIDFGWFTVFAYPLFRIMKWLYGFAKNYGVAIILLTILVKLVTYPLTYKSMKNMRQMAVLNPQIQKLREKFKDDPQRLNREMMMFMKTHGYNPVMGCVPMLIQMPIFFALYRVLYSSVELYQAPFMLWISDLSVKDPFYVTPVLLAVTMFAQQKITPSAAADPMQQKMMQFMPLVFGAMMLNLPSGLTLYMLVNALASIVQQVFLNRKLGMPNGRTAAAGA
ncbi:MAG TPA: membrane protein insertase YidC [Bdellovibrionota bacterium]|nr:membrane protein insertase YidC [Bdellovibrionota bacterium]